MKPARVIRVLLLISASVCLAPAAASYTITWNPPCCTNSVLRTAANNVAGVGREGCYRGGGATRSEVASNVSTFQTAIHNI